MSKLLQRLMVFGAAVMLSMTAMADEFQLTNAGFEDWSAPKFKDCVQPKGWNASNVEQVGMQFNFAHQEAGHTGSYSMMVQDQDVGAMGIGATSPGYFALGQPWAYLPGITSINQATAGTSGGIKWTHKPDSMSVWIRRTGSDWTKEDFYLLYYAWSGTAKGTSYRNKQGGCTDHNETNEESDIRLALNGNECGTAQKATQVAEGMWRERAQYNSWTKITVPIYYMNNTAPTMMNIIFSASNYPNFRANDGLYPGNSLYVDDVELIYASTIQKLFVGGREWSAFNPASSDVQLYELGEDATSVPAIEAYRGAGSLTNAREETKDFSGRKLEGSEITVTNGDLENTPTVITVKSEDGKSTTTYKIQFKKAAGSNSKLASIAVNGVALSGFNPAKYNYTYDLPYGTTEVPVVTVEKQEDEQTVDITQATSVNGTAKIVVTAANGTNKSTYNVTFKVGQLADNTLQDILVNGKSIPGFTPSQAVYKVSLPVGTTQMPTVKAVSAYPEGEQTIVYTAPAVIDGGQYTISVTTPGNTVAKVYKLNFKLEASSYKYLGNLQVIGNQIAKVTPSQEGDQTKLLFTPENTTYRINLKMEATSLPEIKWEKGDSYQTVEETPLAAGALEGTYRIMVTAGNGDQAVYKLIFTANKSDNSKLANILIGGEPLSGFDPDQENYTYELPINTQTLPEIEAVKGDEYQTVAVTTAGVNGTTRIVVTAGDGTTKTYTISFSVKKYEDNTLKSLSVEGYSLQDKNYDAVAFDPQVNEYWVKLNADETKLPEVKYELQDERYQDTAVVRPNGMNGNFKITVRPLNGISRTYTIHFIFKQSDNTALKMIYLDGEQLPNFDPEVINYVHTLDTGATVIPTVTYDVAEASQTVTEAWDGRTVRLTVKAQSGAKRTYKIKFNIPSAASTQLKMIYVGGKPLDDFKPETHEYTYDLNAGTLCPAITVDKAEGQQVTITAPYAAGTAVIRVQMDGEVADYTIEFRAVAVESALLAGININGEGLVGFDAKKTEYEATYRDSLPVVTGVKKYDAQKVHVLWRDSVAWLHVEDTLGNKAAYSVAFSRILSTNSSLEAILINGEPWAKFQPDVADYDSTLAAGSAYPEVGYIAAENAEVVFFGQTQKGVWTIQVQAENGTTSKYTVTFTILPYTDVTLANLEVEGYSFTYEEANTTYGPFSIDEGVALPKVTATTKPGQTVMISNVNDSLQQVLVHAENGDENTYYIEYTREKSNNALLAMIYIDGDSLLEFRPNIKEYTITLPHGRKVVPNVFPVGQLNNQIITTTFSRADGTTVIDVMAQTGATNQYKINFPTVKSTTTYLRDLHIGTQKCDSTETEYTFNVAYGTTEPKAIHFKKDDPDQMIEYISAPITGVTKIIVTSPMGDDKRTYTIRYNIAEPEGQNIINKVYYSYVNAAGETKDGSIVPQKGDNKINLPFGSQSFTVTGYEKNYSAQSVIFYNGGIRRGAKIIAGANRSEVPDAVYTLTPVMPEFETAGKLQTLKFNGTEVPNWRPDVYNYMINVTTQPKASDFTYTAYDGKTVTPSSIDAKKKQIKFTVEGGETYSVCWYYAADGNPFDFSSDWVHATYNGYKPSSNWTIPGDCANDLEWGFGAIKMYYQTGSEVMNSGTNGVLLQTIHGSSLSGSVPGMMTTGTMNLKLKDTGGSSSSVTESASKGITYRNTPDSLAFWRKELGSGSVSGWSFRLQFSDGSTLSTKTEVTGDYTKIGTSKYESVPTKLHSNPSQRLTATINACHTENAGELNKGLGGTIYTSALQISDIHFVYNSNLTKVTVNGKATTKSGNTFTYTLGEDEEILSVPVLKFTGKVHDQMQTIEWLNDGNWVDGELKAKVTNYGENSQDHTVYYVVLKRTPVTDLTYGIDLVADSLHPAVDDTVYVHMPAGKKTIPDIEITPNSIHQQFEVTKEGKAVIVKVTNENGHSATKVYVFREITSSSTQLADEIGNDAGFDLTPVSGGYEVVAERMPLITFEKESSGQSVHLKTQADVATLEITAEDGITKRTVTVTRKDPPVNTYGKIDSFSPELKDKTDAEVILGGTTYEIEANRPSETLLFEFDENTEDSLSMVVFVQTPDSMVWRTTGTKESHTYKVVYPTSKSSNTELAAIKLDGIEASDFDPTKSEYTCYVNSAVIVEPVAAEEETQTIAMTQSSIEGGTQYIITVTAEDGTPGTYTVRVLQSLSGDNTLAGIYLDGKLVEGFTPTEPEYTVVIGLPKDGVKRVQPQMPDVSYVAGHKGQTVIVTAGELNGEKTTFEVISEDGKASQTYSLTVNAEQSHCADLTGITVNGEAIDHFEPGRHFYSTSIQTEEFVIDYTADDRFLTVRQGLCEVRARHHYVDTLVVTAEDGTVANYLIEIYIENQSNDATLANIMLDGKEMVFYRPDLNPDMKPFDPYKNEYHINTPTDSVPLVSAKLKMPGQAVEVKSFKDSVFLNVWAVDSTPNTYYIYYEYQKSTNSDLKLIEVNNELLIGFRPDSTYYEYELAVDAETPRITAEAAHDSALVVVDDKKNPVMITVYAEDRSYASVYYVNLDRKPSDVDSVEMIYEDGKPLPGFQPNVYYYNRELKLGAAFPSISYGEYEANDHSKWPYIDSTTVTREEFRWVHQTTITAQSGKKSTYTIAYTIPQSSVDSLMMIYVNKKALPGFKADVYEYDYTALTVDEVAELKDTMLVEADPGDIYQREPIIVHVPETQPGKWLGYKTIVTATSQTGAQRIYTIHYPVLSSDSAFLKMIYLNGKPLADFDMETFNYNNIKVGITDAIPVVTVQKQYDAQTVDVQVDKDTVSIVVTAEDVNYQQTYWLRFERLKSAETRLREINLVQGNKTIPAGQFPYRPDYYEYTIVLDFDGTRTALEQIPEVIPVKFDEEQMVNTETYELPNGDIRIDVTVTAPNGEDQAVYSLTFSFRKPSDATLILITLGEETIEVDPLNTEYTYAHPFGSTEADYFTLDQVGYVLSDSLAKADVVMDETGKITITVTAQDGSDLTYFVIQSIALDGDNYLKTIELDGIQIRNFDPEVTFYTYYLREGFNPPSIIALPRSENAEVLPGVSAAGDTCEIVCIAADKSERVYRIHFAISNIDDALVPTENDVIIKRVPGQNKLFVASIRQNVAFALYDQNGRLVHYEEKVPAADPNDVEVFRNIDDNDVFSSILDYKACKYIDIIPGQIYFYGFYTSDRIFKSGKIRCLP